jgi:hypothetical protein
LHPITTLGIDKVYTPFDKPKGASHGIKTQIGFLIWKANRNSQCEVEQQIMVEASV